MSLLELRDPGRVHPLWGAYKPLPHLFRVLSPALLPLKTEVRPLTLSGVWGGMAEEGGEQSKHLLPDAASTATA